MDVMISTTEASLGNQGGYRCKGWHEWWKENLDNIFNSGIEHYKAVADVIIQSFTDKIPDETTMQFMAKHSMLRGHIR